MSTNTPKAMTNSRIGTATNTDSPDSIPPPTIRPRTPPPDRTPSGSAGDPDARCHSPSTPSAVMIVPTSHREWTSERGSRAMTSTPQPPSSNGRRAPGVPTTVRIPVSIHWPTGPAALNHTAAANTIATPIRTRPRPSRRCGGIALSSSDPGPRPRTLCPTPFASVDQPPRSPRPTAPNAPEVRSGACDAGRDPARPAPRCAERVPGFGVETTAPRRELPPRDFGEVDVVDRCAPDFDAGRRPPGARVDRVLEVDAMAVTLSS